MNLCRGAGAQILWRRPAPPTFLPAWHGDHPGEPCWTISTWLCLESAVYLRGARPAARSLPSPCAGPTREYFFGIRVQAFAAGVDGRKISWSTPCRPTAGSTVQGRHPPVMTPYEKPAGRGTLALSNRPSPATLQSGDILGLLCKVCLLFDGKIRHKVGGFICIWRGCWPLSATKTHARRDRSRPTGLTVEPLRFCGKSRRHPAPRRPSGLRPASPCGRMPPEEADRAYIEQLLRPLSLYPARAPGA